jgi:hypothetical protein
MERVVFSSVEAGLEVVERGGRLFARYDAGAHVSAWREDEITRDEFAQILSGPEGEYRALIGVQHRLALRGLDPHTQNWCPPANGSTE